MEVVGGRLGVGKRQVSLSNLQPTTPNSAFYSPPLPTVVPLMIRSSTCPICGRELPTANPAEKSFVPFCSERCQLVDFHRWWQGKYAVTEDVDPTNLPRDVETMDDEF